MSTRFTDFLLIVPAASIPFAKPEADVAPVSLTYGTRDLKAAEVNGVEIRYLDKGTGTTVVLLHGALCDYRYWEPVIEALAKDHRVIAPSARHHYPNRSTGDLSDYSYENHAADVIALIEALDIAPVHLVGHSGGGNTAALTVIERPDLVRSLILEEGAFVQEPGEAALEAQAAASAAMDEVPALLARGDYAGVAQRFSDLTDGPGAYANAPESTRQFWIDNVHTLNTPHEVSAAPLACADLATIGVPTLMIRGDSSPKFMQLFLDATETCLGTVEKVTIRGAAHDVHSANPRDFNEVLARFIADND
jgi:pimeloyl-ACP methyl ester carboxylesterase